VANWKEIFVKLPKRTDLFKNKAPDKPFLSPPVIKSWKPWLDVTVYYAEIFEDFRAVINELDRDDASSATNISTNV
jgi:hypothetical protein